MSTDTKAAAELPSIFAALAAAKAAVTAVGKAERNTQQNYNFRGIDAVVNAAAPELDKQGVITAPMLQKIEYSTVEVGQKRTPMAHVRVEVLYRFHGPAGDHLDVIVPGESMDSGDKATAKAMSVAYRIALLQALNLPTSDPDPDTQSYERSPAQARQADAAPPNLEDEALIEAWAAKIDAIATPDDGVTADGELREVFRQGRMNSATANAIRKAIQAKSVAVTPAPWNKAADPDDRAAANGHQMAGSPS
jgi:hypothetical protein